MKPWPSVRLGGASVRASRSQNAEGVPEGSRGLRSIATIPPDTRSHFSCTLKGCENGWGVLWRAIRAPLQGAGVLAFVVRGYRCAQPPANVWHPSRMPPERGCVRNTTRSTSASWGVLHTFERIVRGEAATAGPLDAAALRAAGRRPNSPAGTPALRSAAVPAASSTVVPTGGANRNEARA